MRCWKMRCWDIRRCWGPKKKEKQLMEYEEIVALTCDNAVTELNSAAVEYYDKFREEWHLFGGSLSDDGTTLRLRDEPTPSGGYPYISYGNWAWEKEYPAV